ncbi:MAG: YARHG domain-containing protein, partial [Myxococcota bacterium]
PLYYTRAITTADLEGRSLRELALLRNTIYARVGNRFRRPWLQAHFRRFGWYAPKEKMDTSALSPVDKANAKRVGEFDAALTREQLEPMRDAVLARKAAGTLRPEDEVELSLLSQRLGTYLGDDPERAHPLENHTRLEALLRVEDLATLSRRDLRILRNMVYARRGRTFASEVVRSYFASAAWYRPRADYDDAQLTAVDRKNIAIIRSVEDELGGPIHENPLFDPKKVPDSWFVMA